MKRYVAGFLFSSNYEALALVLKNKPEWQAGKFNGIGGKIEETDPSPVWAMSREFLEETGVSIPVDDWIHAVRLHRPGEYEVHVFFAASDLVYDVKTVESERILLVNPLSLPENIIFNLRWLVPLCMDASLAFQSPLEILDVRGN